MNKDFPKQFNAIVIGLGKIGIEYDLTSRENQVFTHTKALIEHDGYKLVGGVDKSIEKCGIFSKYSGVKAFLNIEELFQNIETKINIAVVSVPTDSHLEVVEELIEYPLDLILLEKPISNTIKDSRCMLNLIKKSNIKMAINYMRRWDPCIKKIKDMIEERIFGNPVTMHCYYSKGLLCNASHYIDLFHFWFGKEKSVFPLQIKSKFTPDPILDFILRYNDFDVYFQACEEKFYSIGEIDLLFENARINLSDFCRNIRYFKPEESHSFSGYKNLMEKRFAIQPDMDRYQFNVFDGIYRSLVNGLSFESTGESSLETLQTCDSILSSIFRENSK